MNPFWAEVAQSVEQGTENPRVGGSIPSLGTCKIKGLWLKAVTPFFIWLDFVTTLSQLLTQWVIFIHSKYKTKKTISI